MVELTEHQIGKVKEKRMLTLVNIQINLQQHEIFKLIDRTKAGKALISL